MKNLKFLTALFAFLLLIFMGCKKENIAPMPDLPGSETPIFSVKGTIGDSTIDLIAGINDAQLETALEYSNNIGFFVGKMSRKQQDLFTIKISDGNINLNAPTLLNTLPQQIQSPLQVKSWIHASLNELNGNGQIQTVNFLVDNVSVGEQLDVDQSGWHDICTQIVFNDQSTRMLCNTVLLGYKDWGYFVLNQKYDPMNSQTQLSITSAQSSFAFVEWQIDGNTVSTEPNYMLPDNQGLVVVSATVTFTNGITRRHTALVDTDSTHRSIADIHAFIQFENSNYHNDFRASIVYSPPKEKLAWGYEHQDIIIEGAINIKSVSQYETKKNGNTIYKIEGVLEGEYLDINTNTYLPVYLELVFGIEMPT